MKYVLINHQNIIEGIFDRKIIPLEGKKVTKVDCRTIIEIGQKIGVMNPAKMKIAVICNWKTPCGISTYTQFLIDALRSKVKEIKIFSEIEEKADTSKDAEENVVRCWTRGESMINTIRQIQAYKPDFVIIQHEFGIFPKAPYFLKLLQGLEHIPYAIVLHSVYSNHFDKTICTSAIKNIIVHSQAAKQTLETLGHKNNYTQVIPHGTVVYDDPDELWNIFQTPYAIMQFGFGFFYKGVDRAIQAIGHLKATNPKYKDIFYCYLCSESANASGVHNQYHSYLEDLIEKLNLHDNVAIIKKYHSEQIINNYLRTAKLALFPYVSDPKNIVFGASGAIRVAMANNIPVLASESHMFDDLEGVIPRPANHLELAQEIDKIFSDDKYRKQLISNNQQYVQENNWNITADRYLEAIKNIMMKEDYIDIQS